MAYSKTEDGRKQNAQYQREWYQRNKAVHQERVAQQKAKRLAPIQRMICEHLQKNPCTECGEKDILVLDFDHVRGEKEFGISEAPSRSVSLTRLAAEIAKCDILCRNCHQRKHALENEWYRVRYLAGTL